MSSLISIIIPCYRSEQYLASTVNEILSVTASKEGFQTQIILVDDHSPDHTYQVIQELSRQHPNILGIRLSANVGQARARMAALSYAKGDFAVFMDDDGQHPPAAVFSLIEKLNDGCDLVYAYFPEPKESPFRRFASRFYNHCMDQVTKKPAGIKISSFFAINSFALHALQKYHSPYAFLGGYLYEITDRITMIPIEQRSRTCGHSRYTLRKLYQVWLNNMLAFPSVPAEYCRNVGLLFTLISIVSYLIGIWKWSSSIVLFASVFLGFGILLVFLGILGEVILRSYCMQQGVPAYSIRETTEDDTKKTFPSDL